MIESRGRLRHIGHGKRFIRLEEWRGLEDRLLSLTRLNDLYHLDSLVKITPAKPNDMRYWLSILYHWWNRSSQQNPYRPKIDPRIWDVIGSYYVDLLVEHLEGEEALIFDMHARMLHEPSIIWETIEFVPPLSSVM